MTILRTKTYHLSFFPFCILLILSDITNNAFSYSKYLLVEIKHFGLFNLQLLQRLKSFFNRPFPTSFLSFQTRKIKCADDWILAADLCGHKRLLFQLSQWYPLTRKVLCNLPWEKTFSVWEV